METLPTLFRIERNITLEQHYQGTTGGRMQLHSHAAKIFGRAQLPHIDSAINKYKARDYRGQHGCVLATTLLIA